MGNNEDQFPETGESVGVMPDMPQEGGDGEGGKRRNSLFPGHISSFGARTKIQPFQQLEGEPIHPTSARLLEGVSPAQIGMGNGRENP